MRTMRTRKSGLDLGVGRSLGWNGGGSPHELSRALGAVQEPNEEAVVSLTWNRSIDWNGEDWRGRAACKDTDPELFFPVGSTGPAVDQIREAKSVCSTCEAKEPCLEFALATNQESGVWGATSEDERRRLRKGWLARQRQAS